MRSWLTGLLVISILAAPLATAEPTPLLTDGEGDVEVHLYGVPTDDSVGIPMENMDLLDLSIEETPELFIFHLGVAGLAETAGIRPTAGDVRIHFHLGAQEYMLQFGLSIDNGEYSILWTIDGTAQGFVTQIPMLINKPESTYTVTLDRDFVVDENGAFATQGRMLSNINVRAYHAIGLGWVPPGSEQQEDLTVTRDQMPNNLEGTNYEVQIGGATGRGPINLTSNYPYRASNGGDNNFSYVANLTNLDSVAHEYELAISGAPDGWIVETDASVTLAPGEAAEVLVFARAPSKHQHGGHDKFLLVASQLDDTSQFRALEMGVYYLATPQPAGHHDTLFLHSVRGQGIDVENHPIDIKVGRVFLNTNEVDGADESVEVWPETNPLNPQRYDWFMCLEPGLLLGLDFDLAGEVLLRLPLNTDTSMDLQFSAILETTAPQEGANVGCRNAPSAVRLATMDPTASTISGRETVDFILTPSDTADQVPYVPGSNLRLQLTATSTLPNLLGELSPRIAPGGQMRLPLNEFSDGVPAGLVGNVEDAVAAQEKVENQDTTPKEEVQEASGFMVVLAVGALLLAARKKP